MSDIIVQGDQQQPTGVMQLLSAAIANNIDPASMAKLYDLHERMAAQSAKEAFRNAMTKFQASCPAIGKDRSGYNDTYRYATLEHIADTIRQPLADVGLSYTFNASQSGDEITTICTVHHVGGHSESSTFTAAAVGGTKMMNVTQVRASALSYGRRYALTMALGLVIREEDDDGASSAPPAAPTPRTDAPVAQPRSDRVTQTKLSELIESWKKRRMSVELSIDKADFARFAQERVGIDKNHNAFSPSAWNQNNIDQAWAIMAVEMPDAR